MNVFLDIDEAFLNSQDVSSVKKTLDGWDEEVREEFEENVKQIIFNPAKGPANSAVFLMRPKWKEYFKFLFLDPSVKSVNLWTWSDVPYAKIVAKTIETEIKKIVNPADKERIKFKLVLGDEHVEESIEWGMENYPDTYDKTNTRDKDLRWICSKYKSQQFSMRNCILVDDNVKNTRNPSNALNSINVVEWNPLDTEDFYDKITINGVKKNVLEFVMDNITQAYINRKKKTSGPFMETIVLKNPKKYISRQHVLKKHSGKVPEGRTTRRAVFYGSKECSFSKEEADSFHFKVNMPKLKGGLKPSRTKTSKISRIRRSRQFFQ